MVIEQFNEQRPLLGLWSHLTNALIQTAGETIKHVRRNIASAILLTLLSGSLLLSACTPPIKSDAPQPDPTAQALVAYYYYANSMYHESGAAKRALEELK